MTAPSTPTNVSVNLVIPSTSQPITTQTATTSAANQKVITNLAEPPKSPGGRKRSSDSGHLSKMGSVDETSVSTQPPQSQQQVKFPNKQLLLSTVVPKKFDFKVYYSPTVWFKLMNPRYNIRMY